MILKFDFVRGKKLKQSQTEINLAMIGLTEICLGQCSHVQGEQQNTLSGLNLDQQRH